MEKIIDYKKHSLCGDLAEVEYCDPPKVEEIKEDRDSNVDALLAEIYAIDPFTGLPTGDIAQYLNADTHPQIKAYIQNQLMQAVGNPLDASSELSDDDLMRYTRNSNESVREYVERMSGYIREDCEHRIFDYAKRSVPDTKDE